MKLFSVTVSYNAGITRTFLVPENLPAITFARATGGLGRIRRMEFPRGEVDEPTAHLLARTSGAIVLDMRGQRVEVSHG